MSGVDEIGDASGRSGSPAGGEAASVTRFLLDLRAFGEGPAPEPSDALAALLGGATVPAPRRPTVLTTRAMSDDGGEPGDG